VRDVAPLQALVKHEANKEKPNHPRNKNYLTFQVNSLLNQQRIADPYLATLFAFCAG
jgi:hypothetical protein